jgi:hypothetical protein
MNAAKTYNELMSFMNIGNKNRSVGETLTGEDRYVAGKLNLVDLAGS